MKAMDFGSTAAKRLANPDYQLAVENLCRNTGDKTEGDVRPILFPKDGYAHEKWIYGEWIPSKGSMPLKQKQGV